VRMSAVWAAVHGRADLISQCPPEVKRDTREGSIDLPLTPFLLDPDGTGRGFDDWMYAGQASLDRQGNNVGLITARDGLGLTSRVELVDLNATSVQAAGVGRNITKWKIGGEWYDAADVWHERQYVVPGVPLGLSPIAYAAWTIGGYLSAQQFGLEWFTSGGIPPVHLKNTEGSLTTKQSNRAKRKFQATQQQRTPFVSGSDWEIDVLSVQPNESQFLETMGAGITDIARFFRMPADVLEGATQKGTVVYANISQRSVYLLQMFLGGSIKRRERMLSTTLPKPRNVHLDTDVLMRLDPMTLVQVQAAEIANHTLAPSEARADRNRPPLTPEQMAEFETIKPAQPAVPTEGAPQ
jgi:HK97 family phage portal protein